MDAKTLQKLNDIQHSLEDLHNSQVAVVQKVAQLETTLMNNPDKKVEDGLVEVYSHASDTADRLNQMLDRINDRVEQANKEFTPPAEGEETKP